MTEIPTKTYTLQRKQQFRNLMNPEAGVDRSAVIQEFITDNLDSVKSKFLKAWYGKELENEMSVYDNYEKILESTLDRDWKELLAGKTLATPPFKKNATTETWTDYQLFEGYNTNE